jgi:Amt family ammonium transporter
VHINAGIAALVTALIIGRRKNAPPSPTPHNLPFTVLGTALLWFGWFGFNAGSSLSADGIAVNAFVVTNTAAAGAALTWAGMEWAVSGRPTVLGIATGAVAGLVAITPAAGFVGVLSSIVLGAVASIACYLAVSVLKPRLGYDDSLDAFGVHCMGGIVGALLTGVFASTAVNAGGADGLLSGNAAQLWPQFVSVAATIGYSFVVTLLLYKAIDAVIGVRVDEESEALGIDLAEHHERAYTLVD